MVTPYEQVNELSAMFLHGEISRAQFERERAAIFRENGWGTPPPVVGGRGRRSSGLPSGWLLPFAVGLVILLCGIGIGAVLFG